MRTTLQIDDDVLEAARAIADAEQIPIGVALSRLARRGLRSASPITGTDLPVFDVPSDAAPITPAMVEKALEAE
jgi:hypothetical protein